MRILILLCLLAVPTLADPTPPAPAKVGGIVEMGPALTPPKGESTTVPVGRFFAFKTADASPSYIPSTDAYRVYKVKPGSVYTGVKYDAAPGATEPEEYSWPDATVYVLLARNKPGTTHTIQPLKNGPADVGPVSNGAPFTIIISGKGPQPPPPEPDPKPDPKPEPTGEGAWIEVIEETSARTLETAGVISDLKFWQSLEAKGHAWRHYDKDAKDIPKGHYKGDTLPILLIVSKGGNQLYRGPLPKTTAEISKIVTETTGK
jgi:hypothetical protein